MRETDADRDVRGGAIMTITDLHTKRASLLARIERNPHQSGITRLRQRLYAVTHEIREREMAQARGGDL